MDKWDEAVNRIKQGMLAEEPEAALAGALEMFANFGRCLELISADTDRIATVLESAFEHTGTVKPDMALPTDEPQDGTPVHDL